MGSLATAIALIGITAAAIIGAIIFVRSEFK